MQDMSAAEDHQGRFRLLVDAIADYAVCFLEPDGTIASWNGGAEHMAGYTSAEVLGRNLSMLYTPDDRGAGLPGQMLSKALQEGRFACEILQVRKDGATFPADVSVHPVFDSSGAHRGFAQVARDLTPQKQAEAALKESEQQLRLLVQGVTDYAIYMLDPFGRVASWNAGAERIKGYRDHEILGGHFSQFYPAEERLGGTPERNLRRALDEGRFEEEGWRVRKDGSTFFAMVVIDPLFDPAGRHIGFAKITRDITERRESEARLEAANAQLFQAQKMEAVGQLTGGVAHDFNNLLMVVRSSLDLLRKRVSPTDHAAARLIENASQAAARGAALTSRMLAFARRQDLDIKEIDPGALLRGMSELVNHAVGINITVETKLPLRLPSVLADPHQLEASILNLVVNARDAMPEGGTILIAAEAVDLPVINSYGLQAGSYVDLRVTDEGTGMDEQTLSRAMEPFFTTKGVGKGSGLGLSMVHGLAQQLGGGLHLRSKPGEGTTAELLLPVAPPGTLSEDKERVERSSEPPRRVLAVDDDALVLMNVSSMLEDLGFHVREAASGTEALRLLEEHGSFDLLITDHAMPKMTGAQLIEYVREQWPELPVIVASGYADIPGGFPAGVPRLAKPFGQDELAEAIGVAMSAAGGGAAPGSSRVGGAQ